MPDGTLITLGFDGARYHDATAIVATVVETGYQWAPGIWECPPGHDGDWEVPADEVEAVVADLFDRFDVWRFEGDPHFWEETLARWAGRFGKDRVVSFDTRGYKRMSDAIRAFTMAIETGALSHDGNPVMARHVGAAQRRHLQILDETGRRMYVLQKDRPDSQKKIDAAMAGVLSWDARIRALADGASATK
ncbi:MAG: terminase, partial [Chloroflexi bacterium]|nr:terminase [Chloroflexota bacterium]